MLLLIEEDIESNQGPPTYICRTCHHIINKQRTLIQCNKSRVNEGAKVLGALSRIWKVGSFGIGVKRMMCERIVVPTVIYGAEAW